MTRTILVCVAGSLFLAVTNGCGSKLPIVEGTVTLDGDPLPDARVVFECPDLATATAKTDETGHFDVRTASERGMAEGSYKVAISAYQTKDDGMESPMPILVTPKKYNSSSSSGFTADIVAGKNDLNFALKSE